MRVELKEVVLNVVRDLGVCRTLCAWPCLGKLRVKDAPPAFGSALFHRLALSVDNRQPPAFLRVHHAPLNNLPFGHPARPESFQETGSIGVYKACRKSPVVQIQTVRPATAFVGVLGDIAQSGLQDQSQLADKLFRRLPLVEEFTDDGVDLRE